MKLIVGGYAQGKLGYVVDKFEIEHSLILDGVLPEVGRYEGRVVINHLNLFIKDALDKGECPEEAIDEVVRHYPDCIIFVMRWEMVLCLLSLLKGSIEREQEEF